MLLFWIRSLNSKFLTPCTVDLVTFLTVMSTARRLDNYRMVQKSEATAFEGSHLQNVSTNLRDFWYISTLFCSECICYLCNIELIYNTSDATLPCDKITNQDFYLQNLARHSSQSGYSVSPGGTTLFDKLDEYVINRYGAVTSLTS